MARAPIEKERPTLLGARVYKVHRKMLSEIAKKNAVGKAAALRLSIEREYERGKES